ncbi:MAG: ABC transporter permease [Geminicoccaceae bacterium]|nr:ABC transporter permease [Geminicoccaceae bacterium]
MDLTLPLLHWDMFLKGVLVTLQLTAIAVAIGFMIAMPCAIIRAERPGSLADRLVRAYVYFFRGTPLLVQTYLFYYGLAQFDFIRNSFAWIFLREAWWCAVIAFSLNSGAYATEILRGALATIPRGQTEAAEALGLSRWQTRLLIQIPLALRNALPQYGNEIVFMLHGSVVASVITIQDILGAGRTLNAKYYVAYEGFITAAILYMAITFTLVGIFRLIEKRYLGYLHVRSDNRRTPAAAAADR